jgi:glycosyltransferase involved in cell wall biosynthesis
MEFLLNKPKVSIIVPVYNVEPYLKTCVNSILSQTFTEFECILVDDCSTDKCSEICDEYAKKDKRIKVVHKSQNEGLPQARKTGFELSSGEYIQFCDSDDWIESTMTERLYQRAISEDADIVYCDFIYQGEFGSRMIYTPFDSRKMGKNDIINQLIKWELPWNLWNKLFSRELFKDVVFPHYFFGEDTVITIQLFLNAQKIGYEYSILYHYRANPSSIRTAKMLLERLENINILDSILRKRNDYYLYAAEMEKRIKDWEYDTHTAKNQSVRLLKKCIKAVLPYGILWLYRKVKYGGVV